MSRNCNKGYSIDDNTANTKIRWWSTIQGKSNGTTVGGYYSSSLSNSRAWYLRAFFVGFARDAPLGLDGAEPLLLSDVEADSTRYRKGRRTPVVDRTDNRKEHKHTLSDTA